MGGRRCHCRWEGSGLRAPGIGARSGALGEINPFLRSGAPESMPTDELGEPELRGVEKDFPEVDSRQLPPELEVVCSPRWSNHDTMPVKVARDVVWGVRRRAKPAGPHGSRHLCLLDNLGVMLAFERARPHIFGLLAQIRWSLRTPAMRRLLSHVARNGRAPTCVSSLSCDFDGTRPSGESRARARRARSRLRAVLDRGRHTRVFRLLRPTEREPCESWRS